jgi:hypothetical protein
MKTIKRYIETADTRTTSGLSSTRANTPSLKIV